MIIYHNPRCSKSRAGLAYLQENGIDPEIRLYLNDLLSEDELKALLTKLRIPACELVRTQEEMYKKELKDHNLSEVDWIKVLVENPKLIHRPIIETDNKAVIGNPLDNIQPLL